MFKYPSPARLADESRRINDMKWSSKQPTACY